MDVPAAAEGPVLQRLAGACRRRRILDRARTQLEERLGYIDAAIAAVRAPHDRTIVVRTKYPWAPLLPDLSLFVNGVVPRDLGGQSPADFFRHPVGTGPFMVTAWRPGNYLRLGRNPYYCQHSKPYLDQVELTVAADDSTRFARLASGDAQIVESQPASPR